MRLTSIELEGFQSYRDKEHLNLDGVHLAAIIGPNHVGKSTIITDALMYALYGASRGATLNDIITRGRDKATVTLHFTIRDTPYRLTRYRTRKGRTEATLHTLTPDGTWAPYGTDTADTELTNLLGMNADTARLTWMIDQGNIGAFCDLKPAPRRAALADAFGLDTYTDLHRAAEQHRRALTTRIAAAEATHTELTHHQAALTTPGPYPEYDDTQLAETAAAAEHAAEQHAATLTNTNPHTRASLTQAQQALADYEATRNAARAQHDQHLARLSASLRDAQTEHARAQQDAQRLTTTAANLDELRAQLADVTTSGIAEKKRLDELREQHSHIASLPATLTQTLDSIAAQGQEIARQIDTLSHSATRDEGTCWTCGQHLSAQDAQTLIDAKTTQRDNLATQWKTTQAKLNQARTDLDAVTKEAHDLDQHLDQLRTQRATIQASIATAEQALASVEAAQARTEHAHQHVTALQDDLRAATETAPDMDTARHAQLRAALADAHAAVATADGDPQQRANLEKALNRERETARRLWREQQRRQSVREELSTLEPRIQSSATELSHMRSRYDDYSLIVEAFKPTGIPAMILNGIVEELNEEANEVLCSLGDDGLGVEITNRRENSTTEDKILITAITPNGRADYRTLSGSEKLRIALSVRIGLSRCIARRTGTPIETLVMDEGWGALDEAAKRCVQDVLTRLSATFDVYTVSHIDDVRTAFPTIIEVSVEAGTSRCGIRDNR